MDSPACSVNSIPAQAPGTAQLTDAQLASPILSVGGIQLGAQLAPLYPHAGDGRFQLFTSGLAAGSDTDDADSVGDNSLETARDLTKYV